MKQKEQGDHGKAVEQIVEPKCWVLSDYRMTMGTRVSKPQVKTFKVSLLKRLLTGRDSSRQFPLLPLPLSKQLSRSKDLKAELRC